MSDEWQHGELREFTFTKVGDDYVIGGLAIGWCWVDDCILDLVLAKSQEGCFYPYMLEPIGERHEQYKWMAVAIKEWVSPEKG